MDAYQAITTRRSQRRFDGRPVAPDLVRKLLSVGLLAPAPHHTRPWRFVALETTASRSKLADAMGAAWRRDLKGDAVAPAQIEALLSRSRSQIEEAPALALACLVSEGLRNWPDKRRQRAEWRMATQSMGCALENILLAAHAEGLAAYWISAPLFCSDAVRDALELPDEFEAQALIAIGYPTDDYSPRTRPDLDHGSFIVTR